MSDVPEIIKSHCNKCGPQIAHKVLSEVEKPWTDLIDGRFEAEGAQTFFILECAGCGKISMRRDSWNSEDWEAIDDGFKHNIETVYYPPRLFRRKPEWMKKPSYTLNCPDEIQSLFNEAYICMQNACHRSTAMAIRATLEEIMIQKIIIDQGSFSANLRAFMAYGYLSERNLFILKSVLETGHAAIHRAFEPKHEDLILCFDIAEQIAQMIFVHSVQAQELNKRIPPRGGNKT